jgi:hypothetical protein
LGGGNGRTSFFGEVTFTDDGIEVCSKENVPVCDIVGDVCESVREGDVMKGRDSPMSAAVGEGLTTAASCGCPNRGELIVGRT